MRKVPVSWTLLMNLAFFVIAPVLPAQSLLNDEISLNETYDLAGDRNPEMQYYLMESKLPPVNLGSNVDQGSYFQNGEITLAFKGLSVVNNSPCALLGYDSGGSSFSMIVNATPEMKVHAVGSSHYKGDIIRT